MTPVKKANNFYNSPAFSGNGDLLRSDITCYSLKTIEIIVSALSQVNSIICLSVGVFEFMKQVFLTDYNVTILTTLEFESFTKHYGFKDHLAGNVKFISSIFYSDNQMVRLSASILY